MNDGKKLFDENFLILIPSAQNGFDLPVDDFSDVIGDFNELHSFFEGPTFLIDQANDVVGFRFSSPFR